MVGWYHDLGLPASKTMRNKFLLFINSAVYEAWRAAVHGVAKSQT